MDMNVIRKWFDMKMSLNGGIVSLENTSKL